MAVDFWRTRFVPLTMVGNEAYGLVQGEAVLAGGEAWVVAELCDALRVLWARAEGRRAEVALEGGRGRYLVVAELPADVEPEPVYVAVRGCTVAARFRVKK